MRTENREPRMRMYETARTGGMHCASVRVFAERKAFGTMQVAIRLCNANRFVARTNRTKSTIVG